MREVKKYLMVSMMLFIYIAAISLLLRSFYAYQMAYRNLSRLISHPSVEVDYKIAE